MASAPAPGLVYEYEYRTYCSTVLPAVLAARLSAGDGPYTPDDLRGET